MPDETLFEAGVHGRPFTVVSRWSGPGQLAEPALLSISGDGMMRFVANEGVTDSPDWIDDTYPLPELAGATVSRIVGLGWQGDVNVIHVVIAAVTATQEPVLVALRREKSGAWTRLDLPDAFLRREEAALQFVDAEDVGMLSLPDGSPVLYGCRNGSPPAAFAFGTYGPAAFGVEGTYGEITHYLALGDGKTGLLQVDGDQIALTPIMTAPQEPGVPIVVGHRIGEPVVQRSPCGPVNTAAQVVPLADATTRCRGIMVRGNDGTLAYLPVNSGGGLEMPQPLAATGAGPDRIEEAVASLDARGIAHVFARDVAARIWHAQWDTNTLTTQIAWEATGFRGNALDAPEMVPGTPGLIYQALNGQPEHIVRTTDGDWVGRELAIGHPESAPVPAIVHAIQISTVTAQAAAVADAALEIRADRRCVVEHEGRLIRLDPLVPTTLRSNLTGSLRLKMRAGGLEAPVLTVNYPDRPADPARFRPQDGALRRLADLDPRFRVTGAAMQAAGLIPADLDAANADKIAATVSSAARTAYFQGDGAPLHYQRDRQFQQDRLQRDRRHRDMGGGADDESAGFAITRVGNTAVVADPPMGRARSVQDVMATSSTVWSDFWGFVTGAWDKVEKVIVRVVQDVLDTAKKIVQIVVKIGEETLAFIADTARRVGEAIEVALGWLKNLGEQARGAATAATKWVAEKLGWDEVVRAKTIVRAQTIQTLLDMERVVGSAVPAAISRELGWLQTQVEEKIDGAVGRLRGAGPLGDQAADSSAHAKLQAEGATVLTVHHAIPSQAPTRELFQPGEALLGKIVALRETAKAYAGNGRIARAANRVGEIIGGDVSLRNGIPFLMGDLLLEMKDLIVLAIQAADVLQTAIFGLLADLIGFARTVITTPITTLGAGFAWVNSMYRHISGGADLDMLDLAALLFVAPGVILHQLVSSKPLVPASIPTTTMYGLLADQMTPAPANGPANDQPQNATRVIDHPAVKFFHDLMPLYQLCASLFLVVRSRLSPAEDIIRYSDAKGSQASSAKPVAAFTALMSVVSKFLLVWQFSEAIMAFVVTHQIELPPQVTLILVLIAGFIFAVNIGNIYNYVIPAFRSINVYMWAVLTFVIAAVCFYFPISALWNFKPADFTLEEQTNFYLSTAASLVSNYGGLVQICVPLGAADPDPISGPAVTALGVAGNSFCYLASGVLSLTAAIRRYSS